VIVCIPVSEDGQVGEGWGRARRLALATVDGGLITGWQEIDVDWLTTHDEGAEGSHHARVARFLSDHAVQVVVAHHMGAPMENLIRKMKIHPVLGASGDARAAVLAAAS